MYCTLQEAYNIPSFVNKKKKGCMNPLNSAAKVNDAQSAPIAKISADSFDAYDPYTGESGKEQAISMITRPQDVDNNGPLLQSQQNPSNNQQSSGLSNKNSPIWGASQGMVYHRQPENFTPKNSMNSYTNDIPYSAQANDYKYYCERYGICSTPQVEGFENPERPQTSVPQSQRHPNVMFSKNGPPTPDTPVNEVNMPYYGPNPMGKCSRLQAPPYEFPISDLSRAQFDKAMEASLNQEQGATLNTPYPMRKVNMNSVAGYYDEELEKFLTTQSMKNEKLPEPLKETLPVESKTTAPVSVQPSTSLNYIQSPQYIMDLLLFIATGILVILLCDQIFKLGMSFGMRDTVHILLPYLEELKKSVD